MSGFELVYFVLELPVGFILAGFGKNVFHFKHWRFKSLLSGSFWACLPNWNFLLILSKVLSKLGWSFVFWNLLNLGRRDGSNWRLGSEGRLSSFGRLLSERRLCPLGWLGSGWWACLLLLQDRVLDDNRPSHRTPRPNYLSDSLLRISDRHRRYLHSYRLHSHLFLFRRSLSIVSLNKIIDHFLRLFFLWLFW